MRANQTAEERAAELEYLRSRHAGGFNASNAGDPATTAAFLNLEGHEEPPADDPFWETGDALPDETVARLKAQLINWDDFWAEDHDNADWLLEPFIAAGRGHSIAAQAKTGKSLVLLHMAIALTTGQPWGNEHHARDPVDVLYIDYEMTPADLHERLTAFGNGPNDNLEHLHYLQLADIPDLDTDAGGQALTNVAVETGAQLVVIDTISRAVGGDENAMETYRDFFRHTGTRLKRAGIAWARLDHTGHGKTRSRGSSAKSDDVDVIVELTATDDGAKWHVPRARMGWADGLQRHINIGENDRGQTAITVTNNGWPEGTKEAADRLDAIGAPTDISGQQAIRSLQEAGKGMKAQAVRAAVRYRQQEATRLLVAAGRPPGPPPTDQPPDDPPDDPDDNPFF